MSDTLTDEGIATLENLRAWLTANGHGTGNVERFIERFAPKPRLPDAVDVWLGGDGKPSASARESRGFPRTNQTKVTIYPGLIDPMTLAVEHGITIESATNSFRIFSRSNGYIATACTFNITRDGYLAAQTAATEYVNNRKGAK